MLDAGDSRTLALLFHLNSEPWLESDVRGHAVAEADVNEIGAGSESVALPAADASDGLLQLIGARRSCRSFAGRTLAAAYLGALLGGTYGLVRVDTLAEGLSVGARAVPSAGGRYPLELYVHARDVETVADGLYHYNVLDHALEPLDAEVGRAAMSTFLLAEPFVETANAIVFLTAVLDRTLSRYGPRGYRFILIESGHAAQNLCLLATERGLGSLCIGGFVDSGANRLLGLDGTSEAVVYCVAVGAT